MTEIILATHNAHKAEEINALLPNVSILTLKDIGYTHDIEETGATLEANALIKARALYQILKKSILADDSGLEVMALNNAPGVLSARYAGEHGAHDKNMALLLQNLEGNDNRHAQFRTVLAFISAEGEESLFEGTVKGQITHAQKGNGGFGYDPIFMPNGYDITFAEMSPEAKNKISHRGEAVKAFVAFLKEKGFNGAFKK